MAKALGPTQFPDDAVPATRKSIGMLDERCFIHVCPRGSHACGLPLNDMCQPHMSTDRLRHDAVQLGIESGASVISAQDQLAAQSRLNNWEKT